MLNFQDYDEELESLAEKEIEKAPCEAEIMKKTKFEAIRDVEHAAPADKFINDPGKHKFACIKKPCGNPDEDPWILVTDFASVFGFREHLRNF